MAKDLTAKAIENLKPQRKRSEVPDGYTRGLFFVMQPSGAASWAFRYRFGGKPKKLTIGPYPAFELKDARAAAGIASRAVGRGEDPGAKKQAAKVEAKRAADPDASDLFENVASKFVERYAKAKTKASSAKESERILKTTVGEAWEKGGVKWKGWNGKSLTALSRADVHTLLDKVGDGRGPIMANRVLAAVRRMCSWAVERGIIDESPCDKVKAPAAEKSRERILTDDEIKLAWAAFETIGEPFGKVAKLLLLSGQRREEVARMEWEELKLSGKPEERAWTIPAARTKNGKAHEVALSDIAATLLENVTRFADDNGRPARFVFTTTGTTTISGFSKAKRQIDAAILKARQATERANGGDVDKVLNIPAWTLHDLRRTAASGMAGLGIAPHVVEAVLNHKSGSIKGVAAVYNRYAYTEEKRAALFAWARYLETLTTSKATSNVVDFATARG